MSELPHGRLLALSIRASAETLDLNEPDVDDHEQRGAGEERR